MQFQQNFLREVSKAINLCCNLGRMEQGACTNQSEGQENYIYYILYCFYIEVMVRMHFEKNENNVSGEEKPTHIIMKYRRNKTIEFGTGIIYRYW